VSAVLITYNTNCRYLPGKNFSHHSIGKDISIFIPQNSQNLIFSGDNDTGYLACGIGIDSGMIWRKNHWQKNLDNGILPCDGHYVIFRWRDNKLIVENDILGLRDAFWAKVDDGFIISTRLDWVAKCSGQSELNFEKLGSLWLGPSMLHWDTPVKNIHRLAPAGFVEFDGNEFHFNRKNIFSHPRQTDNISPDDVLEIMTSFLNMERSRKKYVSLSGGLDSRALLAILIGTGDNWSGLSFGLPNEPDIQIVSKMASELNFPLKLIHLQIPDENELWELFCEHSARKWITIPISVAISLNCLRFLTGCDAINIDGGLGEILRQRVLRRLAPIPNMKLSPALTKKMIRAELPSLFTPEIHSILENGYLMDIENGLDIAAGLRCEEIAEMWAIWFRLPNYSALEQARLDEFTINFMPFVQPSVLSAGLSLRNNLRRKSAVHLNAIGKFAPLLEKYRLSRFGRKLPFRVGVSPYLMRLWLPFTRNQEKVIYDNFFRKMMTTIHNRIMEQLHSPQFNDAGFYNHKLIRDSVKKYFAGDNSQRPIIDWWLTFELWRKSLIPQT